MHNSFHHASLVCAWFMVDFRIGIVWFIWVDVRLWVDVGEFRKGMSMRVSLWLVYYWYGWMKMILGNGWVYQWVSALVSLVRSAQSQKLVFAFIQTFPNLRNTKKSESKSRMIKSESESYNNCYPPARKL